MAGGLYTDKAYLFSSAFEPVRFVSQSACVPRNSVRFCGSACKCMGFLFVKEVSKVLGWEQQFFSVFASKLVHFWSSGSGAAAASGVLSAQSLDVAIVRITPREVRRTHRLDVLDDAGRLVPVHVAEVPGERVDRVLQQTTTCDITMYVLEVQHRFLHHFARPPLVCQCSRDGLTLFFDLKYLQ